eukprot:2706958-Amphidinium_carterae.1
MLGATQTQSTDIVIDMFTLLSFNALSLAGLKKDDSSTEPDLQVQTNSAPPLCQTGQLTYLSRKLTAEQVTVACIQESRLSLPSGFNTTDYHIAHAPAQQGIGGLIIMVAKLKGTRLARHRVFSPRVMAALVYFNEVPLWVVAAHAPIRKSPVEDHEAFAEQLERALAARPQAAHLVGGADLNARFAVKPDEITIVGHLTSGCPHNGVHAHGLLHTLQRHSAHLVNTFMDSQAGTVQTSRPVDRHGTELPTYGTSRGDNTLISEDQHNSIATWKHARSGRIYQIDYILAGNSLFQALASCSTLPWSYMDLLTCSDHRPLVASFVISGQKTKAPLLALRRHQTPQHLVDFEQAVKKKLTSFAPRPASTPFDVTHQLQHLAITALQETKPKVRQPRSSWISQPTWTLMEQLNTLRKLIKCWKHTPQRCATYLPLSLPAVTGAPPLMTYPFTVDADRGSFRASLQ